MIIKEKKGITLIALIITIILLLILAGVTITSIRNSNIFTNAEKAANKYNSDAEKEKQILLGYENAINGLRNETTGGSSGGTTEGSGEQQPDDNYEKIEANLNIINRKSYQADGYNQENKPANIVDDSMEKGNGKNWYGGTKFLLEYNDLSTINAIGVFTTDMWGTSFKEATIYYSENDTLTLNSDLSGFKSIKVNTESKQILEQPIKAKRIILVKEDGNAVYEFQCFGTSKNTTDILNGDYVPTIEGNLNILNVKSYEADDYSQENKPENIIDDNMANGNGKNWYGGTKFLLEYNNLSSINAIGVFTTDNWGTSFAKATIYYSEDDTLTLDSDLSNFKSIEVSTGSKRTLSQPIKAKRVMLVKEVSNAVYEFQCFGTNK